MRPNLVTIDVFAAIHAQSGRIGGQQQTEQGKAQRAATIAPFVIQHKQRERKARRTVEAWNELLEGFMRRPTA